MIMWDRYILPNLEYGDLLRLRRASEQTKDYAEDFLRNNFKSQVREVNETNYPFKHFLQANLPTNSIFLNNSSPAFFEDPDIPEFLRLYGARITHVRIRHFGTFISPLELHFFSSLPNLLHLDLDYIDTKNANGTEVCNEDPQFPDNFTNLKTLKLNGFLGCQKNGLLYTWDLIVFCVQLEYLKRPLFKGIYPYEVDPFGCVIHYIESRHRKFPHQPNLQFYDLQHQIVERRIFGSKFGELLKLCLKMKVKLLNVNSDNFGNVLTSWNSVKPASQLVSLKTLHGYNFLVELPNLEKLVIDPTEPSPNSSYATSWPTNEDEEDGKQPVVVSPKWPNLKILDWTMDEPEQDLLRFLFAPGTWKREKLRELAIRYFSTGWLFFHHREGVPTPSVKHITDKCPFMTKLTLTNWMGSNGQVTLFWEGLPLLEEVELEKCEELRDVAFVGNEREEDPVFLKLKHLKKVSLKGLDVMPKVTDLVFGLVFRHLKIKRFCLTCETPLKSVTAAGIESLLNGDFNNSVEKFPFDDWSLDGVSDEAFLELKQKFRATHMI